MFGANGTADEPVSPKAIGRDQSAFVRSSVRPRPNDTCRLKSHDIQQSANELSVLRVIHAKSNARSVRFGWNITVNCEQHLAKVFFGKEKGNHIIARQQRRYVIHDVFLESPSRGRMPEKSTIVAWSIMIRMFEESWKYISKNCLKQWCINCRYSGI